jgi:hypothetical protein
VESYRPLSVSRFQQSQPFRSGRLADRYYYLNFGSHATSRSRKSERRNGDQTELGGAGEIVSII